MVRKNRPRSSSLFLMELIIAILFFSVASAVCVQFFVKSHLLSRDSKALSHAVNECAGIAESMNSENPPAVGQTKFYYDEAMVPCESEEAAYVLTVDVSEEDRMRHAYMSVTTTDDEQRLIYELNTRHYQARGTGYEER